MNRVGPQLPAMRPAPNRNVCAPCRLAIPLAVFAVLLAATPACGWGDRAHYLITEEAVARLPEPLKGLLSEATRLERLQAASIAPDAWRDDASEHYSPDERPKHFFDIDAITDEPPPFPTFPRDRRAAEARFGPEVFREKGTAPWAAADAMEALADALAAGRTEQIFHHAGAMAHYVADLHMPFHVTENYDGKATGNPGIHKALEIGLVNRYAVFYAGEVRRDRTVVPYLDRPVEALFDSLIEAHAQVRPILEADTVARKKTGYNPKQHERAPEGEVSDLDDVESERARPYYATLKQELEQRGSPEAVQMRRAAQRTAEMLYTAWVAAAKPLSLAPVPADADDSSPVPYWSVGLMLAVVFLLLWPRRKPAPPPSS